MQSGLVQILSAKKFTEQQKVQSIVNSLNSNSLTFNDLYQHINTPLTKNDTDVIYEIAVKYHKGDGLKQDHWSAYYIFCSLHQNHKHMRAYGYQGLYEYWGATWDKAFQKRETVALNILVEYCEYEYVEKNIENRNYLFVNDLFHRAIYIVAEIYMGQAKYVKAEKYWIMYLSQYSIFKDKLKNIQTFSLNNTDIAKYNQLNDDYNHQLHSFF